MESEKIDMELDAAQNCLVIIQNMNKEMKKIKAMLEGTRLEKILKIVFIDINQRKIKDNLCVRFAKMFLEHQADEPSEIKYIMVYCLKTLLRDAIDKKKWVSSLFSFCTTMIQQVDEKILAGVLE